MSDVSRRDGLTDLRVVKNCPAKWSRMRGTDQVRHCTHCSKNVYNLSEMSREEAVALIEKSEGRLCIRYYARPDGTVMTADCPKTQLRKAKRFAWLSGLASVFGLVFIPGTMMGAIRPSPEVQAASDLQHIERISASLKETHDPDEREYLMQDKNRVSRSLKETVERLNSENH